MSGQVTLTHLLLMNLKPCRALAAILASDAADGRGSATPMKMGGRGPGGSEARISSEGNPYQKPKTQRIWPTIFLKMGGLSPALSKIGGTRPPRPPLWRSPCSEGPLKCSKELSI